jgi:hypothetical protein
MMAAAAHNPAFAAKVGIPTSVAAKFNRLDQKSGILKKGAKAPNRVTSKSRR